MLRKTKIIVMDEPTANIDPETDAKLQDMIRTEMGGSTVIVIAHRLHTIADFDKVLVMEDGGTLVAASRSHRRHATK